MADRKAHTIDDLLEMLASDNRGERMTAIQVLGEMGDTRALAALRACLGPANEELYALVVAVGKLKRKLGVK